MTCFRQHTQLTTAFTLGMEPSEEFDDYDVWFDEISDGLDPLASHPTWSDTPLTLNDWRGAPYLYNESWHPTAWTANTAAAVIASHPDDVPLFLKVKPPALPRLGPCCSALTLTLGPCCSALTLTMTPCRRSLFTGHTRPTTRPRGCWTCSQPPTCHHASWPRMVSRETTCQGWQAADPPLPLHQAGIAGRREFVQRR